MKKLVKKYIPDILLSLSVLLAGYNFLFEPSPSRCTPSASGWRCSAPSDELYFTSIVLLVIAAVVISRRIIKKKNNEE